MPSERKGPTWNTRLAKAETLLVLALVSETMIHPWLFARPELPLWAKTVIKMALIVGLFGPVRIYLHRFIDRSMETTRSVTVKVLLLPRVGVHVATLFLLFVLFYLHMHGEMPWQKMLPPHPQQQAQNAMP
jgi:hypothetical protein